METTATNVQTLDLPSSTLAERQAHAHLLLELEAKKVASTLDVPTLPHLVCDALRELGEPIRLFAENNANVRDRLRLCLAKIKVRKRGTQPDGTGVSKGEHREETIRRKSFQDDEAKLVQETKYTHASHELIDARKFIASYSLDRSRQRLQRERKRRWGANRRAFKRRVVTSDSSNTGESNFIGNHEYTEIDVLKELDELDNSCISRYRTLKNMALEGSQYGDGRPLSAISSLQDRKSGNLIVTGGWSGSIKLWDGFSSSLELLATKSMAHEDRIMGIAMHNCLQSESLNSIMLASASIDLSGKLWRVKEKDDLIKGEKQYDIEESAVLKGHQARLCSVAFHPSGRFVGTTSFDHTWRLWDVESGGKELLLQDGHLKEVYGIGFHPDGSLVSTSDFGSVVQLWDIRTGKSACHFLGHAKRVTCTEFSPNGFQLATAGDDGTIKIWDCRQRKQYASIAAHSGLITQIKFAHDCEQNGEYLTSCSFDNSAKVWSTRDWKLLSTLRGHEGKVMGIDTLGGDHGIVTCGYDKTMKIWR
mmetsp:Transcript_28734/g.33382  ORF Transcript_28734/g.33382 Transcript_28734/m.33382 type:complete len:534 (-) Transcript_28734:658-2259(-)